MEAEISIDPATPGSVVEKVNSAPSPETYVEGLDFGTPAAKTPNYKVVQVIDTKMVDDLETAQEEVSTRWTVVQQSDRE